MRSYIWPPGKWQGVQRRSRIGWTRLRKAPSPAVAAARAAGLGAVAPGVPAGAGVGALSAGGRVAVSEAKAVERDVAAPCRHPAVPAIKKMTAATSSGREFMGTLAEPNNRPRPW